MLPSDEVRVTEAHSVRIWSWQLFCRLYDSSLRWSCNSWNSTWLASFRILWNGLSSDLCSFHTSVENSASPATQNLLRTPCWTKPTIRFWSLVVEKPHQADHNYSLTAWYTVSNAISFHALGGFSVHTVMHTILWIWWCTESLLDNVTPTIRFWSLVIVLTRSIPGTVGGGVNWFLQYSTCR